MSDPFKITGPAVISFSGGRTSGYMLWRILQAHGGTLPPEVLVIFANTGKERTETLDFVERCSQRWAVPIHWVEYRLTAPIPCPTRCAEWATMTDDEKTAAWTAWNEAMEVHRTPTQAKPLSHGFACVGWATACRNGEPFEECIIAHKMLPNVVTRFCTQELKIRPMNKLVKSWGWKNWNVCVGIRADEPRRLAKARGTKRRERYDVIHPLATAKVTLADVTAFWKSQPFDLELGPHEGNCDLCFLKSPGRRERLMRDRPQDAPWWIRMEAAADSRGLARNPSVALFRKDCARYSTLLERSRLASLPMMGDDEPDELSIACHCTD